jgi:hypothetical protein
MSILFSQTNTVLMLTLCLYFDDCIGAANAVDVVHKPSPENNLRQERQERQDRQVRQVRQEREERQERQERPERQEKQGREERQERQERQDNATNKPSARPTPIQVLQTVGVPHTVITLLS